MHFFSASDKETDTNNMHLQRHADEGRGRYETYPHLLPRSRARNWDCKTQQPVRPAGLFPSYWRWGTLKAHHPHYKTPGIICLSEGLQPKKSALSLSFHNINTIETQAQSAIEREMLRCNLLTISTCGIHTAQLAQFSIVFIAMPHPWRRSNEIY